MADKSPHANGPVGASSVRLGTDEGRKARIAELVALGDYYTDMGAYDEANAYYAQAVSLGYIGDKE